MIHFHPEGSEEGPNRPILFDGCNVCERRAKEGLEGLLYLDDEKTKELWERMLSVEYGGEERSYRSRAEAKAGREFYYLSLFLQRNMPMVLSFATVEGGR